LEKLDRVIEEIRRLMLRLARSSQQREAEQGRTCQHSSREEEEEEAVEAIVT
jgi:hypothetical protein